MKKYFSKFLITSFILAGFFVLGSFINTTPASAQTMDICQTIDSLVSSGIVTSAQVSAFRIASGCLTPVTLPSATSTRIVTTVANVIGTSTLALSYDSSRKESLLTANFRISIIADERSDIFIPINPFGVSMVDTATKNSFTVSSGRTVTTVVSGVLEKTTIDGAAHYVIPAGDTAHFNVTSTAKPGELFAGTYAARIFGYWMPQYGQVLKVNPAENATNKVTVIGEVSPYITSVTNPIKVGEFMVIKGLRLSTNDNVYIDDSAVMIKASRGDGQTNINFKLPELSVGYHKLQISNKNGMSNIVGFDVVGGGNVFEPGCPLILTRDLTTGSTGTDVAALQNFLGVTPASGYFGAVLKAAVKAFQTANGISPANGFVGPATRAFIAKIDICVPPVVKPSITVLSPNGGETLKMGETYKIAWKSIGLSDNVEIYIRDERAGPSYKLIKTEINPEKSSYSWTIPVDFWGIYTAGNSYKIQVRQLGGKAGGGPSEGVYDESDSYFKIVSQKPVTPVVSTPVYPACGSAENVSTAVKPTRNLCKTGKVGDSGFGPRNGSDSWYWACIGSNTGWGEEAKDTAWCFAPKTEATVVTPPVVEPEIPVNTEPKDCWQSNNAWKISRAWNTPNKDGYWEYDSAVNAQVFYQKEANSDLGTGWRYYKALTCPKSASADQSKYGTVNLAWDSFLKLLEALR